MNKHSDDILATMIPHFLDSLYGHGLMDAVNNEEDIDGVTCFVIYARAYYTSYNANVYALVYAQRFIKGILGHDDYDALKVGVAPGDAAREQGLSVPLRLAGTY